jgi:anti-sigma-K factor RskA
MSHDDNFVTLAAVYAVGALDGEDLVAFERHLAEGCAQCATLVRESQEALERVVAASPVAPPPDVRARLLARVEATAPVPLRRRRAEPRRRAWLAWAAAAAAVVVVSAFTGAFVATRYEGYAGQVARDVSRRYEAHLQEATAELTRAREELAATRDQLGVYRAVAELLRDPDTRVVDLRGLGPNPAATARVVWNERTGGHLVVSNLPPAPPGKKYELWTIAGKTPRPAGLFQTEPSGQGLARVEPVPDGPVKVFAVTLEPESGVPAPTGPMVLASK